MRISDWSSDVCSSDLSILREAADWRLRKIPVRALYPLCALLLSFVLPLASASDQALWAHSTLNQILKRGELRVGVEAGYMPFEKIGRASCRARVCQYVYHSVVPVA